MQKYIQHFNMRKIYANLNLEFQVIGIPETNINQALLCYIELYKMLNN